MRKFTYIIGIIIGISALWSCTKDDIKEVKPSDINNISSFEEPGKIGITWEYEEPKNIEYIKFSYLDKRTGRQSVRLASSYANTIIIPETLKRLGEYEFTIQPFSSTHTGGNVHTFTAISGAALATYSLTEDDDAVKIELEANQLSTNAQEPREGPIENILDDNINTFFHTAWSKSIPEMHYFQVELKNPVHAISFEFGTRKGNNSGDIKRMKISVSNDGEEWKEMNEQTIGLNDGNGQMYSGTPVLFDGYYKYVRFTPTARRSADPLNNSWFNLSIFRLFEEPVIIIDPEAEPTSSEE